MPTFPSRWVQSRVALAVVLLLILGAALLVRTSRGHAGLPYLHHWDEPRIVSAGLRILQTGDLNPGYFNYGSVTIYLYTLVDVAHYFYLASQPEDAPWSIRSLAELEIGARSLPAPGRENRAGPRWLWQISHPTFYLWNRWVSAVFGTASVLLAFLVARGIGDRRSGLLAAAFLAALPIHVDHSAYATTDIPASCLGVASVWLSFEFLRREGLAWLMAALVAVGLAASTKYSMAFTLAAPAAALVISAIRSRAPAPWWQWLALLAVPGFCFLLGTPYALLDLPAFVEAAGYEITHYTVKHAGRFSVEPGVVHLFQDLRALAENLGWLLAPLALIGCLAGRRAALRSPASGLVVAMVALQLWLVSRTTVPFHRNVLFVYPLAAALAGAGATAVFDWTKAWAAGRFDVRPGLGRLAVVAFPAAVSVFVVWTLGRAAQASYELANQRETRSQAVDWINERLPDGPYAHSGVVIASELRIHPADLRRLRVPYREERLLELMCSDAPELWVVPGSVEGSGRAITGLREHYNNFREGGELIKRFPGVPLHLTRYSANPDVQLWRPSPRPRSRADCGRPADD